MRRKIAAIIAADVVGYSAQMARDEEGTLLRLQSSRAVFEEFIGRHHGRIFNTAGDSILAEFSSAVEAVRCALEIQESLRTKNRTMADGQKMEFRIGINLGDVVERDGDLLGDGVNIAARLETLSAPGGICISRSIYEQVQNKISISFADIGPQSVKNIPTPIHAYVVSASHGIDASHSRFQRIPPPLLAVVFGGAVICALGAWQIVSTSRQDARTGAATPAALSTVETQSMPIPGQVKIEGAPPPATPSSTPKRAEAPEVPEAQAPLNIEPVVLDLQSLAGEYVLSMACEKLPWAKGTLYQEFALHVKGDIVQFTRPIHWPDRNGPVVGNEIGNGRVKSDGEVFIDSSWGSSRNSFKVRYTGTMSQEGGKLRGAQDWVRDGRKYLRLCELTLRRK